MFQQFAPSENGANVCANRHVADIQTSRFCFAASHRGSTVTQTAGMTIPPAVVIGGGVALATTTATNTTATATSATTTATTSMPAATAAAATVSSDDSSINSLAKPQSGMCFWFFVIVVSF